MAWSFGARSLISVAALLAACVPPTAQRAAPRPPAASKAAVAASPAPAAAPTARKLQRPSGEVQVLAGEVAIDGGYLAGTGQGSLISEHGGGIISEHGGGLISNNGSQLLAIAGSTKLVSNNGSTVIANNAGSIVAEPDGNVVAAAAPATFGLLEAAPVPATGALTAVAGMRVSVLDLGTGKPLVLGQGPDGQPVTAVYSNARGRFELYLPAGVAGNVRVDVGLPGKADPRLALELLTPAKGAQATVDEDSSNASRLIRVAYAGKLTEMLDSLLVQGKEPTTVAASILQPSVLASGPGEVFTTLLKDIRERGRGKGWTSERARALGERLTELVLSKISLDELKTTPPNVRTVMPVLTTAVRTTRQKAAELMAKDAHYFERPPYDTATPRILKASDAPDYIVQTYFIKLDRTAQTVPITVLTSSGFSASEARVFYDDVFACCEAMVNTLGLVFMSDEAVQAELSRALGG